MKYWVNDRLNRWCRLAVAVYVLGVLGMAQAIAHEGRPGVVEFSKVGQELRISLRSDSEALWASLSAATGSAEHHHPTSDSGRQQIDLARQFRREPPGIAKRIRLENQSGVELPLSLLSWSLGDDPMVSAAVSTTDTLRSQSLSSSPASDPASASQDVQLIFSAPLPIDSRSLRWQSDSRLGTLIVRSELAEGEGAFSFYLPAGETSPDIVLAGDLASSAGFLETSQRYFTVGYQHILPYGLDHVLFVLGLFLLGTGFRQLIVQVSLFTVAHSITLALGVGGWVVLPASLVEPLIALSIMAICLDNVLSRSLSHWRTGLIFLFGLIHGLGFAGILGDMGLQTDQYLLALLSFNVGVELGQLTVIALAVLVVGWCRQHEQQYRRWIIAPASTAIGGIGAVWFVQRLAGV